MCHFHISEMVDIQNIQLEKKKKKHGVCFPAATITILLHCKYLEL